MNTTIQFDEERSWSVRPYLCWVIVLGLGFYNLVYVREVLLSILVVFGTDTKLLLLVDKLGFFFFGVIGLLIILLTEPYFRIGWRKGRLAVRFWKVVALALACLSLLFSILLGLPGLSDEARPSIPMLAVAAALLAITAALYKKEFGRFTAQPDS